MLGRRYSNYWLKLSGLKTLACSYYPTNSKNPKSWISLKQNKILQFYE